MTRGLADLLLRLAARVAPADSRLWIAALRGELDALSSNREIVAWAFGALLAAIRLAIPDWRWLGESALLLATVTLLDWRSPNPAPTIALLALLSATLAWLWPSRAPAIGALAGLWLLAAHTVADIGIGAPPDYQRLPLAWTEHLEIAALILLTLPAALIGRRLRRLA